jgi:CDGSH-type Zn-finger protein
MADPIVASRDPFGVDVEAGTSYWWCACGKSQTQRFCDGSHEGAPFTPAEYRATATAWFCGCKHSHKAPRCDGTRKTL